MLFPAVDAWSLALLLSWSCLTQNTSWINFRFKQIFTTQARLSAAFDLAGLTFCPGLFCIMQAATPPALTWFKSLSADIPKHVWGVYILVLEKPGCCRKLYIGSGTAMSRGARARVQEHFRDPMSAWCISDAKRDGYYITHAALLVHCPIPAPAVAPIIRATILALEAAFSCLFWAMRSRTEDYGFGNLCPWPKDTFEWDGLCSHSPLWDPIHGEDDLDLSPEELEERAAAIKEKNRLYLQEYGRAQRANPTEKSRQSQKQRNQNHQPKLRLKQQAAVENQDHYCSVCRQACRNGSDLRAHKRTKRHLRLVAQGGGGIRCDVCDAGPFRFPSDLKAHEKRPGHLAKVAELGLGLA